MTGAALAFLFLMERSSGLKSLSPGVECLYCSDTGVQVIRVEAWMEIRKLVQDDVPNRTERRVNQKNQEIIS